MSTSVAPSRYSGVAILLHWTIAFVIIANIALGFRMGQVKGLAQFELFQLHKSFGITVLLLSILRLAWRLTHRAPPFEPTLKAWERAAATATHWAFYVLMIAIPLSGWIMVSASKFNIPTLLYGKIPWPHIGPIHEASMAIRTQIDNVSGEAHELLAFAMIGLVVLHILAALKHQFLDGDETLWHMIPGKPK